MSNVVSLVQKVRKRDNTLVDFDQNKIKDAIFKAITAAGEGDGDKSQELSQRVVELLNRRFKNGEIPSVEQIQDIVEEVLILAGLVKTAKAYILYREQRRRVREAVAVSEEAVDRLDAYLGRNDWEVQENANMAFSLQGLNHYGTSYIIKKYWLNKIYPPEIREANESGDFHLHNLDTLAPYCSGWDLYDFLIKGFGGVSGKLESKPPKHLQAALGQAVNFIYTLSGEVAGAVSFSNFDTLLAPFIRYDNLNYQQVKQSLQEFLFNMSIPTRVGFQSLAWDEPIIIRHKGKIKFIEIGKLIDNEFEKNFHRIIEQHPQSFAVENHDDYYTLSFNSEGKATWAKVKAFIRHKVPENSEFLKIRTNRGEAKVSQGHSLFRFESFNHQFNPESIPALEVKVAKDYRYLNSKNHFIALKSVENFGEKEKLDLFELIDELPQLQKKIFVKINPTKTVSQIKENIFKEYQGFLPFWKNFDFHDRSSWRQWLRSGSVRYDVWKNFGEPEREAELRFKNNNIWYPRFLKGKDLINFVKICAWYLSEGHSGLTTPIYLFQGKKKIKKEYYQEILDALKELRALGQVEKGKGFSKKENKVGIICKISGKGLLSELISWSSNIYSFNKVIPWFIFELSPKYQKIFIKTLLKGDTAEYPQYWDYSTTSKKLSSSLSLLLAQNNFRFSVYTERVSEKNKNWRDQYIIRVFKEDAKPRKEYVVNNFEARVCLGMEKFKYQKEYEYDISVDLPQENFVGGAGLLVFHNSPFSNITLDLKPSPNFAKQPVIIGGKPQNETYEKFEEEMKIFDKALFEVYLEGDKNQRVFTFPIPTINIVKDFPWDEPAFDGIFEASAKYGINYFANYINSEMKPEDVRSMCLDGKEEVLIRNSKKIRRASIREIAENYKTRDFDREGWADCKKEGNLEALSLNPQTLKLEWSPVKRFLKIVDSKGVEIITEDGKKAIFSMKHPMAIYTSNGIQMKFAKDVKIGEKILVTNSLQKLQKIGNSKDKLKLQKVQPVSVRKIKIRNYKELKEFYDLELEKNHLFIHSLGQISFNCCRLRLDLTELYNRGGGGLFGSGSNTGSIGVVTIGMARIGYLSKTKREFLERLAKIMDLAKESLEIKRKVIENFMEKGLYPYSRFYLQGIKKARGQYYANHFSTIGLVGMNEALLNFMGKDIGSPEGRSFTLEVLDFMREKLVLYQEQTGNIYNLEATPAESTATRLARKDKALYPDIITAGTARDPYYTNSTMLPVNYTDDIWEALQLQDEIQCKYTGGVVMHLFLGEQISDVNTLKILLKKIFQNFHLPYLTFTPTFSICPVHGYLSGEHFFCYKCTIEQPCEVYSRVVGYYRPVQQFNSAKQVEYKERKNFQIKTDLIDQNTPPSS